MVLKNKALYGLGWSTEGEVEFVWAEEISYLITYNESIDKELWSTEDNFGRPGVRGKRTSLCYDMVFFSLT